jgi:hypothetical protein
LTHPLRALRGEAVDVERADDRKVLLHVDRGDTRLAGDAGYRGYGAGRRVDARLAGRDTALATDVVLERSRIRRCSRAYWPRARRRSSMRTAGSRAESWAECRDDERARVDPVSKVNAQANRPRPKPQLPRRLSRRSPLYFPADAFVPRTPTRAGGCDSWSASRPAVVRRRPTPRSSPPSISYSRRATRRIG